MHRSFNSPDSYRIQNWLQNFNPQGVQQDHITGILIVLYTENTSMKLPGMLLKTGLTTALTGAYLYFKKLFKRKKKTKKQPAKNLHQTKAVRKTPLKPRQKRSPAIQN